MQRRHSLVAFAAMLFVIACIDRTITGPNDTSSRSDISDAVHNGGRTHFYFLPPMVAAPTTSGVFDATLSPVVDICPSNGSSCTDSAIASFSMTSGSGSELVRVSTADQQYIVNWHTDVFNISPGALFRIRIRVNASVIGYADVAIIANAGQAKNINTGEYIPLVDGKTLPIKFRIERGMPVSITLAPNPLTVIVGKTGVLSASVKDAHDQVLAAQPVSWSTAMSSVASVTTSGIVTGVTVGTTTVIVASEAISAWAQINVIPPPVETIEVSPASGTLVTGKTTSLLATLKDADANVLAGRSITWTSSDETVATVDASGTVLGKAVGAVDITATSEGKSSSAHFTVVLPAVASIAIAPSPASVVTGKTIQLVATLKDGDGNILTGRSVSWTSSSANATVDASGLVSGINVGSATISAASEGVTQTAGVDVVPPPVASVEISPASQTIIEGKSALFTAHLKDADGNSLSGRVVTWTSSNPSIVTVDVSGNVTAHLAGSADVTATSEGHSASSHIQVIVPPVALVTVSPSVASVVAGSTLQLSATLKDADGNVLSGRVITWSSSNSLASVNGQGLVTGNTAGLATITATSESVNGSSQVTVTPAGFNLASITAGDTHTCGLSSAGIAYCWGNNSNGQLGLGTAGGTVVTPSRVSGDHVFVQLVGGSSKTCGLKADGTVFCWGYNGQGDLGDGTFIDRSVPTQMNTTVRFTKISSGGRGGCGLALDGTAWCWGGGDNGLLGAGPVGSQPQPVAVLGSRQYVYISSGINNNCALTSAGAAYCWGLDYGAAPLLVPGGHAFTSVTSGGENFCGLEGSGITWCWGTNDAGEFGNGASTGSFHWMPDPVPGALGLTLSSIVMSLDHACGRTTGGDVYCWGVNTFGQLGNGTTTSSLVPVLVTGGRTFTAMAGANRFHNCGLLADGSVYCWGRNQEGQLGDGTHTNRLSPVKVINP